MTEAYELLKNKEFYNNPCSMQAYIEKPVLPAIKISITVANSKNNASWPCFHLIIRGRDSENGKHVGKNVAY